MKTVGEKKFPYTLKTVCFIFINSAGEPMQVGTDITKQEAYVAAMAGAGKIIAVLPGRLKSDAFNINTLEFGRAFGFE